MNAEYCESAVSAVSAGWSILPANLGRIGERVGLLSSTTVCSFLAIDSNKSDGSEVLVEMGELKFQAFGVIADAPEFVCENGD